MSYYIILYIVCCCKRFYLEYEDSCRARSISRIAPKFRATRAKTRDDIGQKMADFTAGIFFPRNRPLADALHLSISISEDERDALFKAGHRNWIERLKRSTSRVKDHSKTRLNGKKNYKLKDGKLLPDDTQEAQN